MESGFKMEITAEYSTFFKEKTSLNQLLQGISKKTLIKVSTSLLGFSNKASEYQNSIAFIQMFFRQENQVVAQHLFKKILEVKKSTNSEIYIFNHITNLCLFAFALKCSETNDIQTEAESEVSIFKAYLLLNEINAEKSLNGFKSAEFESSDIRLSASILTATIAYSDLINFNSTEVITTQIIKSVYLFEYLELEERTKPLLKNVLEYYNCMNWKEYLLKVLPIAFACIQKKKEGHLDIVFDADENSAKNIEFIKKLSFSNEEIIEEYDFKSIRANPFIKVNENTFRVIFDLFVYQFLHQALYFKISEINNNLPEALKIKDFRGLYCNDFSENYLFYKTIRSMFGNRYIKLSGSCIKSMGFIAEPDYYIRNGNKILLFESKDVLLRAEDKACFDYKTLKSVLQKKFYFDEDSKGKRENKAVLQLIGNIKRILNKSFTFDCLYKEGSVTVYPIIVTHQTTYNVAGLNNLVNFWFKHELQKLEKEGFKISKIKPITIICIDDLIFNQDLFEDRKIRIEELVDGYHSFIHFDKKKKYRTEHELKQFSERTIVPFSTYMGNYIAKKVLSKPPKLLAELGLNLFK